MNSFQAPGLSTWQNAMKSHFSASTIVMWLVRFRILVARPMARGRKRFKRGPSSTTIVLMNRLSTSMVCVFSALATAERKVLLIRRPLFLGSELQNGQGFFDRFASHQIGNQADFVRRNAQVLTQPLSLPLLLSFHFRLLIPCMAVKGSGWRELPKLMPHHIFGDENGNEFLAIVHGKSHPDKFGQ